MITQERRRRASDNLSVSYTLRKERNVGDIDLNSPLHAELISSFLPYQQSYPFPIMLDLSSGDFFPGPAYLDGKEAAKKGRIRPLMDKLIEIMTADINPFNKNKPDIVLFATSAGIDEEQRNKASLRLGEKRVEEIIRYLNAGVYHSDYCMSEMIALTMAWDEKAK